MPGLELLVRVGLATVLGVAIGIERQWRSRLAGLQTMALVSMGSALFLILGAFSFRDADPTRVAAQIVTGIGFLGAGVIMKQGVSVTGLNTAATLWSTAAVGALAGAWMWREACAGAAIIIVANTFLHPLAARMDRWQTEAGREVPSTGYVVEVECASDAEPGVRSAFVRGLASPGLHLTSLSVLAAGGSNEIRLRAELSAAERDDTRMENVVSTLGMDPTIRSVRWKLASESSG